MNWADILVVPSKSTVTQELMTLSEVRTRREGSDTAQEMCVRQRSSRAGQDLDCGGSEAAGSRYLRVRSGTRKRCPGSGTTLHKTGLEKL